MMKKLGLFAMCFVLLSLLITAQAGAVTWSVANQKTVAWDATATTLNGDPIPPEDTVKYKVYIRKEGASDDTKILKADTENLEAIITFDLEGRWICGVMAYRIPADSPEDIMESTITWSDSTDVVAVPVPFGVIYFEPPTNPGGFGPK